MAISETTKSVVSGVVSTRKQIIAGLEADIAARLVQNVIDQSRITALAAEITALETDVPKPTLVVEMK